MTDPLDDIPTFLILTAAERRLAWERNPPRPMPRFDVPQGESADTADFRTKQAELSKVKTHNRIAAMKAKQGVPVDLSKHRWDSRHNRFVPLTPEELGNAVSRGALLKRRRKPRRA